MSRHITPKRFSAYQDGELEPLEREQIQEHLKDCSACRKRYEEMERVWKAIGKLEEVHPDSWFYPQLLARIKEDGERERISAFSRISRVLRVPLLASLLIAVGILAGAYLGGLLVRCDFLPFQPGRTISSQEAFLDSLRVFDPAPPGTLAHGYLQLASFQENQSR